MNKHENPWTERAAQIGTISLYVLLVTGFCLLAFLLKDLLKLFVFGLLINYLLSKPALFLTKLVKLKPLAIFICFAVIFYFFLTLGSYIYPIFEEQCRVLEGLLPQITSKLEELLSSAKMSPENHSLSKEIINSLGQKPGRNLLADSVVLISSSMGQGSFYQLIAKSLLQSIEILTQFVLTLVISFYLLLDGQRLWQLFVTLFPAHYDKHLKAIKHRIDHNLYALVLGQFQLALLTTLVMLSTYLLIANEFAVLLGALQMLEFIPILGTWIAIVPSVLIVAATSGPSKAILVATVYLIYTQIIRDHIIAPRVIGKAFGVHPLVVIFGLLIGIKIFGLIGIIVSLPLIAIISAVVDYLVKLRNKTEAHAA
jgi:predicted PurR-regulated permease PerM